MLQSTFICQKCLMHMSKEPCLIQHCIYNSSYATTEMLIKRIWLVRWHRRSRQYMGNHKAYSPLRASWAWDINKWWHYILFACSCTTLRKASHWFTILVLSLSYLDLATVPSVLLVSSLQLVIVHPIHVNLSIQDKYQNCYTKHIPDRETDCRVVLQYPSDRH